MRYGEEADAAGAASWMQKGSSLPLMQQGLTISSEGFCLGGTPSNPGPVTVQLVLYFFTPKFPLNLLSRLV